MGHYDWIDADEYPDDDDIEAFGDDSPPDDDPLTIGYVGEKRPRRWTVTRVVVLVFVLILIAAAFFPFVWGFLQ